MMRFFILTITGVSGICFEGFFIKGYPSILFFENCSTGSAFCSTSLFGSLLIGCILCIFVFVEFSFMWRYGTVQQVVPCVQYYVYLVYAAIANLQTAMRHHVSEKDFIFLFNRVD